MSKLSDGWQVPFEKSVSLKDFDPAAKPFSSGNKQADIAATEALAAELDDLQNLFYADKRYKLLVVLQGTDTSGKDGTKLVWACNPDRRGSLQQLRAEVLEEL